MTLSIIMTTPLYIPVTVDITVSMTGDCDYFCFNNFAAPMSMTFNRDYGSPVGCNHVYHCDYDVSYVSESVIVVVDVYVIVIIISL